MRRFLASSKRASKMTSKKHRKKCENQGFWLPQTVPKSTQNASQNDVPKSMRFFMDFGWHFVACCKGRCGIRTIIYSVLLTFHAIQYFACRLHLRSEKLTKNPPKTTSEPFKNRCRKRVVFWHRFFRLSASIWGSLGPPR